MSTMACPNCSEIIPTDVDYCPFCGESTRVSASSESLLTDEDRAVADRLSAIAAANTSGDAPSPTYVDPALRLPPAAGQAVCMMCKQKPPTMGDYCLECHEKLELGPEQWDLMKQEQTKRNTIVLIAALVAILILALVIVHVLHHEHRVTALPTSMFEPRFVGTTLIRSVLVYISSLSSTGIG